MKEITAVIRRDKPQATKKVLEELGFPSVSIQSIDGRGKQRGMVCDNDLDPDLPDKFCTSVKLTPTPSTYALEHSLPKVALFVPKRMLTMVVPDDLVTKIVKSIISVNKTGKTGDGKIFISPVEGAIRVRTSETGGEAIG